MRRSCSATAWASNDESKIVAGEPEKFARVRFGGVGRGDLLLGVRHVARVKTIASHIKKTATDNSAARIECKYRKRHVK